MYCMHYAIQVSYCFKMDKIVNIFGIKSLILIEFPVKSSLDALPSK